MHTTRVFVSGVASRTHLLYVASYLSDLLHRAEGPVVVRLLALHPFLGRPRVAAEDVRALLPHDVRLTLEQDGPPWTARPGERLVYVAVGGPGIKPLLRLRAAHPLRRLHVVAVDEGLGGYGTWRTRRDAWVREGHRPARSLVRALVTGAVRAVATDEAWTLYRLGPDGWQVDPRVATGLRATEQESTAPSHPYAVLLTQPWVQLGLLTPAAARSQLDSVAHACRLAGLQLRVRPHPAEDGVALPDGVQLLPSDQPAELDPAVRASTVVLGAATTALLNVAALGLAPAVRIDLPGAAAAEAALSPAQRSLLAAFLGPAVTLDELADQLRARGSAAGPQVG